MESGGKQGSLETSSEENDELEQVKEDTAAATGTKRSYECTFCKRGFTNAQALGGHMNIHRKDRAKNKQVTGGSSSVVSSKPMAVNGGGEDCMNPRYIAAATEQANYYPVLETQRNYFMYYQPPVSNPKSSHGGDFLLPGSQYSLKTHEERLLDANLSLGISSKFAEDKEDELDLELRLGHNP